jgi:hypothetical protein
MNIFNRLFGNTSQPELPQPAVRFGRYSDSYKTEVQYTAWEASLKAFEKGEIIESVRQFLTYIRDEEQDNVRWFDEKGGIRFELMQGSRLISGFAGVANFQAETKVAKADLLNIGFMRRLVEQNFGLTYSRYALDDEDNIVMIFNSFALDASPWKLYYALKEVATTADKQDDLLVEEFGMLQPLNKTLRVELPAAEKESKYEFVVSKIKSVLHEIETGKLNGGQYPGGIAYLLLDMAYRLDYLVRPEGFMMETLERIHRTFFTKDEKTTEQRNLLIRKEFQKIADRPKEQLQQEMYKVSHTFGITSPDTHERLVGLINGELPNMDWYQNNGHDAVAISIPGYIAGHALFHFALPKPDKELLHLYIMLTETAFFRSLGYTYDYLNDSAGLDQKAIKRAIQAIAEKYAGKYPNLSPDTNALKFDSRTNFARSYMQMLSKLDYTEKTSNA